MIKYGSVIKIYYIFRNIDTTEHNAKIFNYRIRPNIIKVVPPKVNGLQINKKYIFREFTSLHTSEQLRVRNLDAALYCYKQYLKHIS
jgi:hypothetical protein